MKRTLTILSAALLTTALVTPLMAQPVPPINTGYGEHHPNVEAFDSYLDAHIVTSTRTRKSASDSTKTRT